MVFSPDARRGKERAREHVEKQAGKQGVKAAASRGEDSYCDQTRTRSPRVLW
jgi:hypothetical protein